jgi:tRNA pseudouridine55 synthase
VELPELDEEGVDPFSLMLPVEAGLTEVACVVVDRDGAARLRRGQSIILRGRDAPIVLGQAYATLHGKLIALVEGDNGEIRPKRAFHL